MKPSHIFTVVLISIVSIASSLVGVGASAQEPVYQEDWESLANHQTPQWLIDGKFGIFIHWMPNTVPSFHDDWYARWMYVESHPVFAHHKEKWGDQKDFGYIDFIPMFKAERWDPDEWAALFEEIGARFVIPNAEHHDHFATWDSDLTTWDSMDRGPKRDIVGELSKAVRKRGMKFGVSNHRARGWNFFTYKPEFDTMDPEHKEFYWPQLGKEPDAEWLEDWQARLYEVIEKYQPDAMWFDYGWADRVFEPYKKEYVTHYYNDAAKRHQPVALIYKGDQLPRGVGVLDVERGKLDRLWPEVWMTDTSVFETTWAYIEGARPKPANEIIDDFVDIISKNGTLLLNIGPKSDGTISEDQVSLLREIGAWMKHNAEAVYGTRPFDVFGESDNVRYTRKGNALYVFFLEKPSESVTLKTLSDQNLGGLKVVSATPLGSSEQIAFRSGEQGLTLTLPQDLPGEHAWAIKLTLEGIGFGRPAVRIEQRVEGGAIFARGQIHNFTDEPQSVDVRLFINRHGPTGFTRVHLEPGESDDVRFQHRDQNHYGARHLLVDELNEGIYHFQLGPKKPQSAIHTVAFPAIPMAGKWLFKEGDDEAWSQEELDVSDWKVWSMPREWPIGRIADKVGWYRKQVEVPAGWKGEDLELNLGVILDTDRIYFNGELVGERGLEKVEFHFSHESRELIIPASLVKPGQTNTIAVRVYSVKNKGGLIGPPGWLTIQD